MSITEQVPIITVEILSRSTRTEDTICKSAEYAADGIAQYWIVDRDQRTVAVGEHGRVTLDLLTLLDR